MTVHSLAEMKSIARTRGGACLSKVYVNQTSKLQWKCGICGHQWSARPAHVINGSWCPLCGRKKSDLGRLRHSIDELDRLARDKGGRCLSEQYAGRRKQLHWKCAEGHEWFAQPGSILAGTWCPRCHGSPTYSIEDMKTLASSRGGKCLSKQYVRSQAKLRWKCSAGHSWEAVPASIVAGRWCPECGRGLGERLCRAFFEQKFKQPFPNKRPEWLLDRNGKAMELDGYNNNLKIAFEHHGLQHYQVVGWNLSPSARQLAAVQARDKLRRKSCRNAGVALIVVPSIGSLTPIEKLEHLITTKLRRQNIRLPKNYFGIRVDYSQAYRKARITKQLAKCQAHALSKGGRCLAIEYVTARQKVKWECDKGHKWDATPDNVLRAGTWCPQCKTEVLRRTFSHTIETMWRLACKRGGLCLSNEYKNSKTPLRWQCKKKHEWISVASNVLSGSWCPECAGNLRLTLEAMHRSAKDRQGKCLSVSYINSTTHLRWQCKKGHIWGAIPMSILRGSWCPRCAIEARRGRPRGPRQSNV